MLAGQSVSWRGVNDISARPAPSFPFVSGSIPAPTPNTLGDLTNRENRIFRPRFNADYLNITQTGAGTQPEAKPDDFGGAPNNQGPDGIADYYPSLYPNALQALNPSNTSLRLVNPLGTQFTPSPTPTLDTMPFPYLFPGAYSVADFPHGSSTIGEAHFIGVTSGTNTIPNHSPIDRGDNLPTPVTGLTPNQYQTYWGWPTWKETLSPLWTDPVVRLIDNTSPTNPNQSVGLSWVNRFSATPPPNELPPMTVANGFRLADQPFNDGRGTTTFAPATGSGSLWFNAWEDDLIMTGVRSFDIKAFDPNAGLQGSYQDLGYGSNGSLPAYNTTTPVFLSYNTSLLTGTPNSPLNYLQSFAHEGRMPPVVADNRPDAKWPFLLPNLGDDTTGPSGFTPANTLRMRRVWCSWSTEYSNAPDLPLDPSNGPLGGNPPVYPSYPAPYPAPLRAIQIQIRVVNQPDSDRVRVLTIRQDFSDKL